METTGNLYHEFLSTPSARRATSHSPSTSFTQYISIHALREEGDAGLPPRRRHKFISIHALREEGDCAALSSRPVLDISIHALREEGDRRARAHRAAERYFYPRPPRGGRHGMHLLLFHDIAISIHALREEGDDTATTLSRWTCHFYPRPPRGGRHDGEEIIAIDKLFLSTPSARRATSALCPCRQGDLFLSTPSARRATDHKTMFFKGFGISIHALREEGDATHTP